MFIIRQNKSLVNDLYLKFFTSKNLNFDKMQL